MVGVRAATRGIVLAVAALLPGAASAAQTLPDFVNAADASRRIVQQVLKGPADSAQAAVIEAFQLAGIATYDAAGVVREAASPALPFRARTREVAALVSDLRSRTRGEYRATLADVASGLTELGWKPQSSDDPARALAAVLAHAIAIAETSPLDAQSFVPLFLRESALLFTPGVGLAAAEVDPETVDPTAIVLGDLELQLLLSMLMRSSSALSAGSEGPEPDALPLRGPRTTPQLHLPAPTPCSDWLDQLPEQARPNASYGMDAGSSYLIDLAMNAAGETAGTVAGGVSALFKLLRIMSTTIDKSIIFELDASADTAQYRERRSTIPSELSFTATARLGPEADRWNEDPAIADCLKFLGFSIPDGREALLKAISGWRVEWGVTKLGGHATFSRAKNPDFATHTRFTKPLASGDGVWTSTLTVDMAEEKQDINPSKPVLTRFGNISMYAALDQSQPPDYSLIMKGIAAGAAFGGPAGSAVFTFVSLSLDVLEGLWQQFNARKAHKTVVAAWNEPGPGGWYGTIVLTRTTDVNEDTTRTGVGGSTRREKLSIHEVQQASIAVVPESVDEGSRVRLSRELRMESLTETNEMVGCPVRGNNQQYARKSYSMRSTGQNTIQGSGNGHTHVVVGVREDGSYSVSIGGLPEFEQNSQYMNRVVHSGGCEPVPPTNEAGHHRMVENFQGFVPFDFEGKAAPGATSLSGSAQQLNWKLSWSLTWKGERPE